MTKYLEYELDDGSTVLIQVSSDQTPEEGLVQAGIREGADETVQRAGRKFGEAMTGIRIQAANLRQQLSDLKADEVEVKFALKATAELGNFAVGNIGVEANYEVTLKWNNNGAAKG